MEVEAMEGHTIVRIHLELLPLCTLVEEVATTLPDLCTGGPHMIGSTGVVEVMEGEVGVMVLQEVGVMVEEVVMAVTGGDQEAIMAGFEMPSSMKQTKAPINYDVKYIYICIILNMCNSDHTCIVIVFGRCTHTCDIVQNIWESKGIVGAL